MVSGLFFGLDRLERADVADVGVADVIGPNELRSSCRLSEKTAQFLGNILGE